MRPWRAPVSPDDHNRGRLVLPQPCQALEAMTVDEPSPHSGEDELDELPGTDLINRRTAKVGVR